MRPAITSKVLYLGIDPPPGVFHYPVIATRRIDSLALLQEGHTHYLFTSKSAVRHFFEVGAIAQGKEIVAIGEGTQNALKERGLFAHLAPFPTQEGMIAWLEVRYEQLKGASFCYLRSTRARPHLATYLAQKNFRHQIIDLYETFFQCPKPIPMLSDFEEIVFTSPSTVEGFLQIFGQLPKGPRLTPIGPITLEALSAIAVF